MAFVRNVAISAAVLLLAGCASTTPTDAADSPDPKPPVSATPTPTATAAAQPLSRLDLTCEDLADTEMIELVFGKKLDSVDPLEHAFSESAAMFYGYPELQQGGILCLWQNGVDESSDDYVSVNVDVLPDAKEQYDNYATESYLVEPTCSNGYCSSNTLVDDTWVQVFLTGVPDQELEGAPLPAEVVALINNIAGVIQGAGAPIPAAELTPAPDARDCATIIDADVVASATGILEPLTTFNTADGPQVGMSFDADGNALISSCAVAFNDGNIALQPLGALFLPDAEWAMRAAVAHGSPAGTSVEQAVEGIPEGDAFQRCESVHEGQITCYLDMLVDSTWVQLALTTTIDAPTGAEIEADPIDALTEIATSVATKL